MATNSDVMLITQTRVKPNMNEDFELWLKKINKIITQFPGYISQENKHPNPPLQLDWILIQNFVSIDAAKAWLQSKGRQDLLKEAMPLLVGMDNVYIMEQNHHDENTISAAITTKVDPKNEQKFLNWQLRVAALQSKSAGFRGYKLEKPRPGIHDSWITLITFDSDEHLDAWLNSPERQEMLKELNSFSDSLIEKLYSGFDFWFKSTNGSQRTIWKENMLVLLTLYPVVFLLSYIQNPLMKNGMPFWFALFLGNFASTWILGYITVPWLMKKFQWWLNPKKEAAFIYTILGIVVVLALYAVSMVIFLMLS